MARRERAQLAGALGLTLPWLEPAWLEEARAWIENRVDVTGEPDQFHVRWWSTVLRVPTADGDTYFKAVTPGFGFEPPLTKRLAELAPDRVPEVLDLDADQGWFLMRDGGRRLRELVKGVDDLAHWERALPRYAELQLAATGSVDELLALGVPDVRLALLPAQLGEFLADPAGGLSPAFRERVAAALPELEALCTELAAYGIAETIQHDDLHDGQVFVRDGSYVFFDWGDSCISHPFHSLTVTLRATAAKLGLAPGGPELRRLRDAYLEPFAAPAGAAEVAYRTGTVARAVAWARYVRAAGVHAEPEDDSAPAYGLGLFLENGPIGSWQEPAQR